MYRLKAKNTKTDPDARWNLPDRVFFACGACHILAYAFCQKYPDSGFSPKWIKPVDGFRGSHIVLVNDETVFDYHGYSSWPVYYPRYRRKARLIYDEWDATLHDLPVEVLISSEKSKTYDGLVLREPEQFLYNASPRANRYLSRFSAPDG